MYGENENNSLEEAEIPGIEGERLKHSFQRKMLISGAQKSVQPEFPEVSLLGTFLPVLTPLKVFGFSHTFATSFCCCCCWVSCFVFETGSRASRAGLRLHR